MAQSEQARLIASLQSKGYTVKQLATLTGRSPRYITLARDSETKVGRGGKEISGRGQNLIPLLKELDTRGKVSPASIPERRKNKAGQEAKVRKGVREFSSKSGKQHVAARVKRGPATVRKAIQRAAKMGRGLKWDINYKRIRTISDKKKQNAWATGHLPRGWDAQTLLDRIDNPREGDNWKAGDVNGALSALTLEENNGVVSASGPQEYSLYTLD